MKAVALALTIDITYDGDVLGPTSLRYAFPRRRRHVGLWPRHPKSRHAQEKLRRIQRQFTTYRDTDDLSLSQTEHLLIF